MLKPKETKAFSVTTGIENLQLLNNAPTFIIGAFFM